MSTDSILNDQMLDNKQTNITNNSRNILFYILLHLIVNLIFNKIFKKFYNEYIYKAVNNNLKKKSFKSEPDEIDKLQNEAEKYNNPQDFVKWSKLQKQINMLIKEKERKQLNNPSITINEQQNDDSSIVNILLEKYLPYVDKGKIMLNIILVIFNIFIVIFTWNKKLEIYNIDSKYSTKNIIFNYFTQKDDVYTISIPLSYILISQSFFINRINKTLITLLNK